MCLNGLVDDFLCILNSSQFRISKEHVTCSYSEGFLLKKIVEKIVHQYITILNQ